MRAVPLLVFADDWGRHPSSAQHLVGQLLPRRRVSWVNTIGTRKPRLDLATLKRGFEKLRHWSRPTGEPLPPNLTVLNPRMWPWFSHSWDRAVNRRLLAKQLRRAIHEPPVVITALPLTAELVGEIPAAKWVYYCVDDFGAWPGLDGAALRKMEQQLVAKVDRVIAVSETLRQRLKALGRDSELLTHGVDPGFWQSAGGPLPEFQHLPKPLFVFWGVIDRRMDTEFVRQLAAAKLGTVLLVGPQNDPDPELLKLPVTIAPPLPLSKLPALARMVDVLVMPYADLPVTRAIQPLKLKEYLATGLPVVVRDLPANRDWADCLDLADSPTAFVAAVKRRLAAGVPDSQRLARQRLDVESWAEKARYLEHWIDS
ncbi:MAG: hypothetical protein ACJ8F7_12055 [Gemmataceae bacterium]